MTNNKFTMTILYIILLFAIPLFLMIYCLRCERLRLSSQKRMIERIIDEQRLINKMKEFEVKFDEDEDEDEYTQ
jgi:preprotein translocase subunit YajC